MNDEATTPGTLASEREQPEPTRTEVRWLDPVFGLAFGPVLLLLLAPNLVLEPWMPWEPLVGVTLLGFCFGWRVVVGPRGVSVARTLLGVPVRFYRLGPSVGFLLLGGFDEDSDGIEVRGCDRSFEMGALRRGVLHLAYEQIVEGIERAGLEAAPPCANSLGRRVFQPRSAPITF